MATVSVLGVFAHVDTTLQAIRDLRAKGFGDLTVYTRQSRVDSRVRVVTGPDAVVARAQYDRARAYFRLGKGDSALALLAEIPERFPAESSSANALALAADLAVDAGNDSAARARWRLPAPPRTAPMS